MKAPSEASFIFGGRRQSIARQTLRRIAVRISIVVAIATILSYWHVRRGFEKQALEVLERYAEQRRDRESAIFDLASGNLRTFSEAYSREIKQIDPRDAEQRFSTLFEARPDGTTRLKEAVFNTYGVTGFIGKHVVVDKDLKRRLITAFDLIKQFGPAWSSQFANLYVMAPEGAVIMYWPEQPWGLKASDWELAGKLSLLSADKDSVVVAGPSSPSISNKERWSELYFDYGIKDWLVSAVRPTPVDGSTPIQIGQDILINELLGRAISEDLRGTYNFLFSEDGELIAHPRFMDAIQARSGTLSITEIGDPHLTQIHQLATARESNQVIVQNDHYDEIVALTKLSGPEWILATVFPLSLTAANAWEAARIVLMMGVLALLIELLILSSTLRAQIAVPLRQLVRATGSVAEGRFGTQLDLRRNDELGELAEAFTIMARQVDAREMALKERSERLAEINNQLEHELVERERAERELTHHRELNALLDTIDYGILFLDPDLRIRLANRAFKDMWALPEPLVEKGTPIRSVLAHNRNVSDLESGTSAAILEGDIRRIRQCDEEPIEVASPLGHFLRYHCVPLSDGGRMLTYLDITDQKQALEAIAAAEQRQRRLLELAPFPLAVTRASDGVILYTNARTAEVTGLSPEKMQGTLGPDYYARPEDRERVLSFLSRDGRANDVEVLMQRPDGHQFWALVNSTVADYEGTPALLSAFNDISELKHREKQLKIAKKETEAALRDLNAVLETIQYGVLFLDPDMRIRLANRAYRELWDMPAGFYDQERNLEEDMEQSRSSGHYAVSDDDWETYKQHRLAEIQQGSIAPTEMHLRNNKIVQYRCIALPDGGRMLTYFDITELKQIEEILRRHLAAMEASMDGMALLTPDATYEYLNAAHLKIFGYDDISELKGRSWRQLYADAERHRLEESGMRTLVREGRWSGEAVGLKRDGSTFPHDVSLTMLQNGGLICVVRDISERYARDEALREAKRHAEDASRAKSQFLANMSHELRTPLNAVLGYTELLMDGLYGELPAKADGVLKRVQVNGRHLLALINDVLDLSKIEAGELSIIREPYSVQMLIQTAISTMEPLAKVKDLELRSVMPDELPTSYGDERRLMQVMLNLIGNAIKFTDKGYVEVSATADDVSLTINLSDTGIGITEEDQEQIFGAFQQGSNREALGQGGTGLGLAISKRIIEMHGGSIAVHSKVGFGSTFTINLPLQQASICREFA